MFKRIAIAMVGALFLTAGIIVSSETGTSKTYAQPAPTPTFEGTPVKPTDPKPTPSTKPTV